MSKTNTNTVLHIAPTPFFSDRGCHIRIEGIANCLSKLGYENLVCTYHHGRDVLGVNTLRISPIKNYTKTEAGPSKYKLWADWKLLWVVLGEIRRVKPTVIHAHLHEGLMIALVAKTLFFWKRIPLVADMQGSLLGELEAHRSFDNKAWLRWPVKMIEASLMFFAKTIVCSSVHSLEKIKHDYNLNETKLTLVQDGAKLAIPLSDTERKKIIETLELPNDKKLIVYSGALLDSKGLKKLKELIALCRANTSIHFLIIGYPIENLASFLADEKLNHLCTLTGQVAFEKLHDLLQLADIAIDPKFNDAGEGSGKMLNYLACGLPVLAFNNKNNAGFLPVGTVLPNTVEEMAQQLQDCLSDDGLLKTMRSANAVHFAANYSWKQTELQLASVYEKFRVNQF